MVTPICYEVPCYAFFDGWNTKDELVLSNVYIYIHRIYIDEIWTGDFMELEITNMYNNERYSISGSVIQQIAPDYKLVNIYPDVLQWHTGTIRIQPKYTQTTFSAIRNYIHTFLPYCLTTLDDTILGAYLAYHHECILDTTIHQTVQLALHTLHSKQCRYQATHLS